MYGGPIAMNPARQVVPVTLNADLGDCRGLLVGAGGTADLVDADGNARSAVPLQTGYNPIAVRKVTALGSATGLWALI